MSEEKSVKKKPKRLLSTRAKKDIVRRYLSQSISIEDLAKETGWGVSTIMGWRTRYFPIKNKTNISNKKKKPSPEILIKDAKDSVLARLEKENRIMKRMLIEQHIEKLIEKEMRK